MPTAWSPADPDRYVGRWAIDDAGETITTPASRLVPGTRLGRPVMLKVARIEEEARGARVLAWWNAVAGSSPHARDSGAAPVLEIDDHAVLLERADDPGRLARLSAEGRDDEATAILCDVVARLHAAPVAEAPAEALPLDAWFAGLIEAPAGSLPTSLARGAARARDLLAATTPDEVRVLHGDVHHGNVLRFGERWLAIDPKGLLGHRAFDLANLFCNPTTGIAVESFERRLGIVAERSGLDPRLLREWVLAWCALSAAWTREAGSEPWTPQALLESYDR
ncbi:hypothetical protein AS850_03120 [Frondihabitans sp. 762G35]|uniref:aminoglycoside phosphotransferase family protein n=1 Tax=Frondihabitans sp. 762G35 TaxID=1446794 RepID=UPI000D2287B3|nr:aminoglycoside phosphotransferase family protein [Frondihabitans sp. 762G35]ARC56065.1 hypothetical protein AS850_03120 [Frondihabitans sp. 762G35]